MIKKIVMALLLGSSLFALCNAANAQQRSVINTSFELPVATSLLTFFNADKVPGWDTTDVNNAIEIWQSGYLGVLSARGAQHAELNANSAGFLSQDICLINGETLGWVFQHRRRNANDETAEFVVKNLANNTDIQVLDRQTSTANSWKRHTGSAVYTGPTGIQKIGFRAVGGAAQGNFLDAVKIDIPALIEMVLVDDGDVIYEGMNTSIPVKVIVSGLLDVEAVVPVKLGGGGTATLGSDFNVTLASFTIPPGNYISQEFTLNLSINTLADNLNEPDETLQIELGASSNINVQLGDLACAGQPLSSVTYTIVDGQPPVSVSKPAPTNADEDGSGNVTLLDTLTYTITATNDSTVTLSNVVVSDPLITPNSQTCATVKPGASCVLQGTHVVSLAEEKAGSIANTASAMADELTVAVTQSQRTFVVAAPTFTCDNTVYQVQSGVLRQFELATGLYTDIGTAISPAYNSAGYNVLDKYMYGQQELTNSIVRIHADGTMKPIYPANFASNAGDIDNNNHLWLRRVDNNNLMSVDLATGVSTELTLSGPTLSVLDFAYISSGAGNFLVGASFGQIVVINLDTGVSQVKQVSGLSGPLNLYFGAAWSDSNGRLWVYVNHTGNIFEINDPLGVTPSASLVVTGAVSNQNDGMFCRNSPFPLLGNPSITLEKPAPTNADEDKSGDVTVGDTLTYTLISAANDGNVALHNVVVSDPLITPSSKTCTTLLLGEKCELTGTYVVTQADVDAGEIKNTASVVTDEITTAETAAVTTPTAQDAILDVVKTADISGLSVVPKVGDKILYSIVVTNVGDVSLNNIVIVDNNADAGSIVYAVADDADRDDDIDLLAAGESAAVSANHTITQADIAAGQVDNQAIATGKAPDGSDVSDTSDNGDDSDGNVIGDVTVVEIKGPVFTCDDTVYQVQSGVLRKIEPATGFYTSIGTRISPSYNSIGYNVLDNYMYGLQDRKRIIVRIHADGTMKPLYSMNFSSNAGDIDNNNHLWLRRGDNNNLVSIDLATGVTNELTLTGSMMSVYDFAHLSSGGGNYLIGAAFGRIVVINLDTGVSQVKSVSGLVGRNFGAAWSDSNGRLWVFENPTGKIFEINDPFGAAPSATLVIKGQRSGSNDGMFCHNAAFPVLGTPSVTLSKPEPTNADEDKSGDVTVGDTLTYTLISAVNDGNVPLYNVVVSDPLITPNSKTCDAVQPGDSCDLTGIYVVTQTDVDAGEIKNIASVVSDEITVAATASVTTQTAQRAILDVVKTADISGLSVVPKVGDKILYSIVVTNAGDVSLNNIVITDNNADAGSIAYDIADDTDRDDDIDQLASGESATITVIHTITASDITAGIVENQAIATGKAPDGSDVSDSSDDGDDSDGNIVDDVTVANIAVAELGVAKQAGTPVLNSDGSFDIEFTLLIQNTGNAVIDNLQVSDQLSAIDQLGGAYTPSTSAIATGGVIAAPRLMLTNTSGNSILPSIDTSFDGGGNFNLLMGSDGELAPGDQLTATFTVRIDPNATNAPSALKNSATVSGTDPSNNTVTDVSDNGVDPQTNPGKITGTPTPITSPTTEPELGIAKQAGTPTLNSDGTFDIDFMFVIENTGNVVVDNLQLTDVLNAANQLGSAFIPSTAANTTSGVIVAPELAITLTNISGNSFTPSLNTAFDGGSNANLFTGMDGALAPGDELEVSFSVRIDPNAANAPAQLKNSATVSGEDPADNSVSDASDNGTDPKVNPGETVGTPTPITPPVTEPELGVAKQAGTPTLNDDGTFDVVFSLLLENTGNVVIDNLQLADQLDAADQLGSAFSPSTAAVTAGGVITPPVITLTNTSGDSVLPNLDPAFDGGSNANLFVGSDGELAPGDQLEIIFVARIDPNATNAPNPLQNSATASGEDPSDSTVSDVSDSGIDPQTNPGETTGTPTAVVPPATKPQLGVAKQAGIATLNNDGTFDVDFTLLLQNTGNVVIDNLQLADQLDAADQLGTAFVPSTAADTNGGVIVAPALTLINASGNSIAPSLDAAFDGGSNADLFTGLDGALAPGDQVAVTFSVRIDSNAANAPSPLQNSAIVSGEDPSNSMVSDVSDAGSDPKTNPGETTGTATSITPPTTEPELGVAKQAGTPVLNSDGTFDINFTLIIENTGDVVIDNLQLIDQLDAADQFGSAFVPSTSADTTGGVISAPTLMLTNASGNSITPSLDIAFDGGNNANLFGGTNGELAPGDQLSVTFSVRIDPNAANAPAQLQNSAIVSGDDPADNSVSDVSDAGTDPQSNPGEATGTATLITPPTTEPQLGVAKQAGTPTLNADGTFDIDFTLLIENTGDVVIDNLQLSDQLNATDQQGSAYTPSTAVDTGGGVITAPTLALTNTSGNSVAPSLNLAFDGGSNANLFAGSDGKLAPGDKIEMNFSVRIDPNAINAPSSLRNSATVSGEDPADNSVSDASDNGVDPQINPGETVGTPTPITPPVTEQELGVAKQAGTPTLNDDGTFDVAFSLLLENTGNVVIDNLQLADQLNAADQLGSAFTPSTAADTNNGVIIAPVLTLTNTSGNSIVPSLDLAFDGGSNANLLLGTDGALVPGDQIEITFNVRINPNATNAPSSLQNSATVSGDDPADNSVSDVSDTGSDPQVNPGESTGTATSVTPPATEPQLGVAKQASTPILNADGTFDIGFTLVLENTGNVVLDNLQLVDQLDTENQLGSAFAPSTAVVTTGGVITAPSLALTNTSGNSVAPSIDSAFDGGSNANLLLGTDGELAPGDQLTVTFSVRVDPNAANAPAQLQNSATVSGDDPADNSVSDISDSGANPQANPGETTGTPTPITPPATEPELGVAKKAGIPSLNEDGTFDTNFTLVIQNTGDVVIDNLQLADQLNAANQLGSAYLPSTAAVTNGGVITAPTLTLTNTSGNSVLPSLDTAFDGGSNANLLLGTDGELAPGDKIEIAFSVRVDPNAVNTPAQLRNSAIVSGKNPADKPVTDKSDNGTDPEVNPGENSGTPTPIMPPASEPELGVAKQAGTPTLNADGSFDIAFTLLLENTGDVIINNLQLSDQLNAANQLGSAFTPSTAAKVSGGVIVAPALRLINTSGNSIAPSIESTFDGGSSANLLTGTDGKLAPGDQLEITFSVRIDPNAANTPNPLQNSATVSGDNPAGNSVSDKSDNGSNPDADPGENTGTATPIILPKTNPSLDVTDVANTSGVSAIAQIGDVIEYTYTITNTGDVTLTDINVADTSVDKGSIAYSSNNDSDDDDDIDQLLPGESVIVTARHTITQADIDAAMVISQATVTGSDPAMNKVSDQSDNGVDTDGNSVDDPTQTQLAISTSAQLSVVKTSSKLNVQRGEIIPYTIQVENLESYVVPDVTVVDRLPAGFKYVEKSATLDAVDVSDACTAFTVGSELRCMGVDFEAHQKRTISLLLVSGAGVSEGKYVNLAWAEGSALDQSVSNAGRAIVYIRPDPIFDCTDVIGKVYDDKNHDGYQNKGEEALPNVRLATARGLVVTTDEHGRYHISCAAVPNPDRGSNFIVKVDERSLPSGYRITTENPRVVRLTRGKIEEADFGAAIHRVVRLDVNSSIYKPDSSDLAVGYESHLNELLAQLVNSPSVLRIGYVSQHENKRLVRQRIKSLRKAILNKWQQQGCCYRLLVEHEITQIPLKK